MGSFSIWHWLIVLAVVLLLFGGRGKVSQLMGDFGKGLKAFKKGVASDDSAEGAKPAGEGGEPRTIGSGTTAGEAKAKDQASHG